MSLPDARPHRGGTKDDEKHTNLWREVRPAVLMAVGLVVTSGSVFLALENGRWVAGVVMAFAGAWVTYNAMRGGASHAARAALSPSAPHAGRVEWISSVPLLCINCGFVGATVWVNGVGPYCGTCANRASGSAPRKEEADA